MPGLPRLSPWYKADSGPCPARDSSDRPVAAVVRGQAAGYNQRGRTLPSLQAEIERVKSLLEGAGYHVVLLEQGAFIEFEELRDEGLRERLVVFHYAGHATPAGLLLQSDDNTEYLVDTGQLAHLLSPCDNLRVLFLNGCHSRDQLRTFDAELLEAGATSATDYAFIGAVGEIGDAVASAFATAVYERLAKGSELGTAVRDANASARLAAVAGGLDGGRATAALRFKPREQNEFRLRDGAALIYDAVYDQARQIDLRPFALYLPGVGIAGALFALAAYHWDPSPAFRAAFGLEPDDVLKTFVSSWSGTDVSDEHRRLMGYPEGSTIQHVARTCSSWLDQIGGRHEVIRAAYNRLDKDHGTLVDVLRTVVLTVALLVVVLKARHMRFPRGVPMLSHVRPGELRKELTPFAKSALGGSFIGIFLLGVVLLVIYHAYLGPKNLALYWPEDGGESGMWEGRWVLLHCLDEVWHPHRSGSAGALVTSAGDGTSRAWSSFVDKADPADPVSAALYAALYQRPYAILSGNSAANFLLLMLPIAYIIARSARYSWYWTDLGMRRVSALFRAPKVNEERISAALMEVRNQARIATRTFSVVFFAMSMVGVFEIVCGRVSLASMAQLMTVIAVIVFAVGGLLILILVFGVEQHRNDLVRLLHLAKNRDPLVDPKGELECQLEKMSVFRSLDWLMIACGVIVIALSVSELLGKSNLTGLS